MTDIVTKLRYTEDISHVPDDAQIRRAEKQIIAWLREISDTPCIPEGWAALKDAADRIERGAHRKGHP